MPTLRILNIITIVIGILTGVIAFNSKRTLTDPNRRFKFGMSMVVASGSLIIFLAVHKVWANVLLAIISIYLCIVIIRFFYLAIHREIKDMKTIFRTGVITRAVIDEYYVKIHNSKWTDAQEDYLKKFIEEQPLSDIELAKEEARKFTSQVEPGHAGPPIDQKMFKAFKKEAEYHNQKYGINEK